MSLCTRCAEPIRPVVALDIDGTLGDYHRHLLKFAGDYLGHRYLPAGRFLYDGGEPYREWFCRSLNVDERTFRDVKLAYRQGAQKRSMPPFRGAAEVAGRAKAAGAEVWIATTRPYLRLDNIDPDTRFWLRRHGVEYDHLIYGDEKYAQLSVRVGADRVAAVLDDLGEMYDEAAALFGIDVPILARTYWNRGLPSEYKSADDLAEASSMIVKRIGRWEERHK